MIFQWSFLLYQWSFFFQWFFVMISQWSFNDLFMIFQWSFNDFLSWSFIIFIWSFIDLSLIFFFFLIFQWSFIWSFIDLFLWSFIDLSLNFLMIFQWSSFFFNGLSNFFRPIWIRYFCVHLVMPDTLRCDYVRLFLSVWSYTYNT